MTSRRVRVELLGPLRLLVDGVPLSEGGPKLRAVLGQLALANGRVVSVDDLLDGVWGEDLPNTARNTLQYHVGVLRKTLAGHDAADALVTRDPGYALVASTDVAVFLEHVSLGGRQASAGDHAAAAVSFTDALNLWRGRALADLREFAFADVRAVALESQRLTCAEAWADAELACGRADTLISPLQEMLTENPTRERLWEQLMIALYRTGRQDAALSAYRSARTTLDQELGVEPSARLNSVHEAILRHDPKLEPVAALKSVRVPMVTRTTLVGPERPNSPPSLLGPRGVRLELGHEPVVLGRQADCDLVLADEQASRRHAEVARTPAAYVVIDLGSTNGTFVNGIRLESPVPLSDGDRIEIGHSVVQFVAPPG